MIYQEEMLEWQDEPSLARKDSHRGNQSALVGDDVCESLSFGR
jgi:hypothetical protein